MTEPEPTEETPAPPEASSVRGGSKTAKKHLDRWPRRAALALLGALVLGVLIWRIAAGDPGSGETGDPRPSGRLTLEVLDGDGGPIPGATVTLQMPREGDLPLAAQARTDGAGRVTVLGLPDGQAQVTVERAGYARASRVVPIADGGGAARVLLEPGAQIRGQVVDRRGEPVADAAVRVQRAEGQAVARWHTRTDAEGAFLFDTLRSGAHRLDVEAAGYDAVTQRARTGEAALRIVLGRTGAITGRVLLGEDGAGAPGAMVILAGSGVWPPRQVLTGERGGFRFGGVPDGVYEVRARLGELIAEPREGLALDGGATLELVLRLAAGRTLRGLVVTAEDGTPIEGAEVIVREQSLSVAPRAAVSDDSGAFEVVGLLDQSHEVHLRAAGYVALRVSARPGADVARFELRRSAVLAGVVLGPGGAPVTGASVTVTGTSESGEPVSLSGGELDFRTALFQAELGGPAGSGPAGELGVTLGAVPPIPLGPEGEGALPGAAFVADAQGRFRVEVPPGRIQLTARHPGHAPATSTVLLVTAGSLQENLELVMALSGRIEGRVVDARDFPVGHVPVEMRSEREPFPRMTLAAEDGSFTFDDAYGRTYLTAYPAGRPAVRTEAEVTSGETTEVVIRLLSRLHTLSARTVDDRGFPIAGVRVTLRSLRTATPTRRVAESRVDGTLRVTALPPPPWRVGARHAGYASVQVDLEEAPDGELTLALSAGAALRGRIMDSFRDVPAPGAAIELRARGHRRRTARSESDGRFELLRVPAGNYTLRVTLTGFIAAETRVVLESRPHIGLPDLTLPDIRLPAGGSITGEVVDALGDPAPGAEVTWGAPPDWGHAARTDARGRFRLDGIAPGPVVLSARHPAAGEGTLDGLRARPTEELPAGRLHLPERLQSGARPVGAAQRTGVAIAVADADGAVRVTAVVRGSNAASAGIRVGDILVSIDGEPLLGAAQAGGMFRGPSGTEVVLALRRGERTRRVVLRRERYTPP